MLVERESELLGALATDLAKPPLEAYATDVGFVISDLDHARKHLERWMAPEKVHAPLATQPGRAWIQREPLGVVLVIAPWNYPVQLTLAPLVGALAAGNAAVVKPSELSPTTSAVLARWIPEYTDGDAVAVVQGAVEETTALLEQRWDHIFYTGNGRVGRVVMRAAAEHLTPVTLELGGKSPVVVDRSANLAVAAKRIAWGKYLNAGQTCIAPDYVLCHDAVVDELTDRIRDAVRAFYGPDPRLSADYARIVDTRHLRRLVGYLGDGEVAFGGQSDEPTRYIAPTALRDVADDAPSMTEEIFGPVLPIRVGDRHRRSRGLHHRTRQAARAVRVRRQRRRRPRRGRPHVVGFGLRERHPLPGERGRPALRRCGRERHRGLPRPAQLRGVQPRQGRPPARDAARPRAGLPSVLPAQGPAAAPLPLSRPRKHQGGPMAEHLPDAWDAGLPADDNLIKGYVHGYADLMEATAAALGWPLVRTERFVAVDAGTAFPFQQTVVPLRPFGTDETDDLLAEVDAFYAPRPGGPYLLWCGFPVPSLADRGWQAMGHPPLMFRPPGGPVPPVPDGLEIVPVTTLTELEEFTTTLVEAFPVPQLTGLPYGGYGPKLLEVPDWRMWIGRMDGRTVATSAVHVHGGINDVEWISARPETRGRGVGAAVTWAATLADPALPAMLIASDLGQPVYERMGYLRLTRFSLWFRTR